MNEHAGHRERMKRRFLTYGLNSFDDHNVLELLLFYALPRTDTNLLAHRLLKAFGSLDGVFDASPDALRTVEGIGDNAAALIHLVAETSRRYIMSKGKTGQILKDSTTAGNYLLPRFAVLQNEVAYLVCMDAKLKVLDCRELSWGGTISVGVDIRQIVLTALGRNATYALLAHNHTSGIALPSDEDVAVTLRIRQVLAQVGVTLTDHIVVAGDDFVSMADSGLIPSI